jgi:hypothetical protein
VNRREGACKFVKLNLMDDEASEPTTSRTNIEAQCNNNHEKLVDAATLLTLLWEQSSRPSLRWLREQQARRSIPFIKVGARVWFIPSEVERALKERWTVRRR